MIYIKSEKEIDIMKKAALAVVDVLQKLRDEAREGVSTWKLNEIAEEISLKRSLKPAFKGYANYPAAVCFALNEEVVHAIPSKKKVLREGDILGMDYGVFLDGFYGDSAITVPVGKVSREAEDLLEVTKSSLEEGIKAVTPDNHVYDISRAIQDYVESRGYSVVRSFVGHGIGRELHEEPQVPNFVPGDQKRRGIKLKPGMVFAIEPMVNQGSADVRILDDGWTAVTVDGKLSAHFEHMVAVTDNGPEVLTRFN